MDAAEWNSGNARHSAERARDLLVEDYIQLEPSAQRAIVRLHRLNHARSIPARWIGGVT